MKIRLREGTVLICYADDLAVITTADNLEDLKIRGDWSLFMLDASQPITTSSTQGENDGVWYVREGSGDQIPSGRA